MGSKTQAIQELQELMINKFGSSPKYRKTIIQEVNSFTINRDRITVRDIEQLEDHIRKVSGSPPVLIRNRPSPLKQKLKSDFLVRNSEVSPVSTQTDNLPEINGTGMRSFNKETPKSYNYQDNRHIREHKSPDSKIFPHQSLPEVNDRTNSALRSSFINKGNGSISPLKSRLGFD